MEPLKVDVGPGPLRSTGPQNAVVKTGGPATDVRSGPDIYPNFPYVKCYVSIRPLHHHEIPHPTLHRV